MFEDINHSGDGGLYGELLTNRAFDGSTVTWGAIPDYLGSSITYQENPCEAYGELRSEKRTKSSADSDRAGPDWIQARGKHPATTRQSPSVDTLTPHSPGTRHSYDFK